MSEKGNPLLRITSSIDTLISKHGSQKAADLIEALSLEDKANVHSFSIDLQQFVIDQVVKSHKINLRYLQESRTKEYKKARITCFYLLKEHCNLSLAKIKQKFPKYPYSRAKILKDIKKMEDIISLPKIDNEHYLIYQSIITNIEKYKQK